MSVHASQDVEAATISAVVRRADGTVEDLGVVSYAVRAPLRRFLLAVRHRLGRRIAIRHVLG